MENQKNPPLPPDFSQKSLHPFVQCCPCVGSACILLLFVFTSKTTVIQTLLKVAKQCS